MIVDRFPHQAMGSLAVTLGLVNPANVSGIQQIHSLNVADLHALRPWDQLNRPVARIGLFSATGVGSVFGWQMALLVSAAVVSLLSLYWIVYCARPERELRLVGEMLEYAALACLYPD